LEAAVTPYRTLVLAHSPTPFYRLEKLSDRWGGEIWIKRDDLTGSGMTGNKVRKLEQLIADADSQGADTLITCGGVQSNHCRATSLAAARLGYKCILLLRGEKPGELDGNLLLDRLAGAEVVFASKEEYSAHLLELLGKISSEVRARGGKPYVIAEGGSDPVGAWAYVEALRELKSQCEEAGVKPDRIVFATGSGGTHAGLEAGVQLEDWDVDVVSAAICYTHAETTRRVGAIVDGMNHRYGLHLDTAADNLHALDQYIGPGYAKAHRPIFETIAEVARTEGVLVDPVYTGKAAWAIKSESFAGRLPGVTVFWHTGGIFGLFPFRAGLSEVLPPL
jgi:D-cysteine desulfhydrase